MIIYTLKNYQPEPSGIQSPELGAGPVPAAIVFPTIPTIPNTKHATIISSCQIPPGAPYPLKSCGSVYMKCFQPFSYLDIICHSSQHHKCSLQLVPFSCCMYRVNSSETMGTIRQLLIIIVFLFITITLNTFRDFFS